MTTKECPNDLCSPQSGPRCVGCPPLPCRPSLESLPNEILGMIFSYLVPEEISQAYMRLPKDPEPTAKVKDESQSSQRLLPSTKPPRNPLSLMSTNLHFFQIGRQQPLLRNRVYSLIVSVDSIEFEGHRYRGLERLQSNMPHITSLQLVFDVGNWGDNALDGTLSRFLQNYQQLLHAFDCARENKHKFSCKMNTQGRVFYQEVGDFTVPDCFQAFTDQLSKTLVSRDEKDLKDLLWWADEDCWEMDGDSGGVQKPSLLDLFKFAPTREIADSLRLMASFLYRE